MNEILRIWTRRLIPLGVLLLVGLVVWGNLSFVERAPAQSPFVARWVGLRVWLREGGSPYDPAVSLESQTTIYGRAANLARGEDPQHFLYPPAVGVILGPFALLPLSTARALWMSLLQVTLAAVAVLIGLLLRWRMSGVLRLGAAILALLSLPGVLAVLYGDVAVVVVAVVLLSLAFAHRRWDTAAGFLAAVSIAKPHLGAAYIAYLVVWGVANRRWNLLGWLTTALALLLGISTVLVPTWPIDIARQTVDYAKLDVFRSVVSRVLGSGSEPYGPAVWIGSAVLVGYLLWEWRLSLRGSERSVTWAVMLTLVATTVVSPFATVANQVLLIPPLLLAAHVLEERLGAGRNLHAAFLMTAFSLGSWLAVGEALQSGAPSTAALLIPPTIVLVMLWWVRWWAIRPPLILEAGHVRHPE